MKITRLPIRLKRSLLLFILPLVLVTSTSAQYGPSLTAGSEGLVFGQGQLDAQVILGIIATKSGEVKKELGKRLILKKLEGGSYAFYSYAEKNLNVLFNEANKSVITKELMQNSAELLLVYGLAEYILQDIRGRRSYDAVTANLIERLYAEADSANKTKIREIFGISFHDDRIDSLTLEIKKLNTLITRTKKTIKNDSTDIAAKKTLKNLFRQLDKIQKQRALYKKKIMTGTPAQNNNKATNLVLMQEASATPNSGKYLLKPEIMPFLTNRDKNYQEPGNNYYSGLTMFIDMIYDACIRNKYVISTGMFQSENKNSDRYKALSKYWFFDRTNREIFKDLSDFQPKVDSVLNYLFQYYHLFIDFKSMADDDMRSFFKTLHENGVYAEIEHKIDNELNTDYLRSASIRIDNLKQAATRDSLVYKATIDGLVWTNLDRFLSGRDGDTLTGYLTGFSVNDLLKDTLPDTLATEVQTALAAKVRSVYEAAATSSGYQQMKQQNDTLIARAIRESLVKKDTYTRTAVDFALEETQRLLDSLRANVLTIGAKECKGCSNAIFNNKLEMQKKLLNIPLYIKTGKTTASAKEYLDLAYTIKKEYLPELTALNLQQEGGIYNDVIRGCDNIMQNMNAAAYYYMVKDSSNINKYIYSLKNYIPLLDIINNLDRVESYDYMFKFLSELSETYGDPKSKMVARILTNAVDKYSILNKQENKISIDVEAISKDVFARFAEDQHTAVYPFFTVGLNQNSTLGNGFRFIDNPADTTDPGSSQSSFVGEKIGIKWNMFDFNRKRGFNHYDLHSGTSKDKQRRAMKIGVEPAVNNVHAFVYASGILYQIKALSSADYFKTPVIGAGAGITFFNGLDLNLSYVLPVTFKTNEGFLCISFDIALFDYLGALTSGKK